MKRLYLPLILFLLMISEGVALDILPKRLLTSDYMIVPHWVFIFLIFITIFYDKENTYYSVLYGVIFGLLIDIVYTGYLGIYMFSYALVVYIIHGLKKRFYTNILVTIVIGIIGISIADIVINLIYSSIGVIDIYWKEYLQLRLLPTILANIIFLIIFYSIVKKKLILWKEEQLFDNQVLKR